MESGISRISERKVEMENIEKELNKVPIETYETLWKGMDFQF